MSREGISGHGEAANDHRSILAGNPAAQDDPGAANSGGLVASDARSGDEPTQDTTLPENVNPGDMQPVHDDLESTGAMHQSDAQVDDLDADDVPAAPVDSPG